MPDEKDAAQTTLASLPVQTGQQYSHFKSKKDTYLIVATALHEDTLEPLVVYRSTLRGTTWVRTMANFTEYVDRNSYSGPRFVLIS